MDQEELAAKRKMVESWLSSQAAGPAGAAGGGAAGADTIAAAGGAPAHARGRSGGAGGEVLAGSPAKLAVMAAPDVALALGDEPGGKAAGKAGSMADDSSQPDSEGTSAVRPAGLGWDDVQEVSWNAEQHLSKRTCLVQGSNVMIGCPCLPLPSLPDGQRHVGGRRGRSGLQPPEAIQKGAGAAAGWARHAGLPEAARWPEEQRLGGRKWA